MSYVELNKVENIPKAIPDEETGLNKNIISKSIRRAYITFIIVDIVFSIIYLSLIIFGDSGCEANISAYTAMLYMCRAVVLAMALKEGKNRHKIFKEASLGVAILSMVIGFVLILTLILALWPCSADKFSTTFQVLHILAFFNVAVPFASSYKVWRDMDDPTP